MTSYRVQGLLAIGSSALALAACSVPDLNTNLRPDGPPEVLTMMTLSSRISDGGGVQLEYPSFCKADDTAVPTIIGLPDQSVFQVCPDPTDPNDPVTVSEVADADPQAWYIRVVFDELLDPNIETLTEIDADGNDTGNPCTATSITCNGHIAASHPFTLNCGAGALSDVAYDGYYAPNGNKVSWPPGPSLVVFPTDLASIPTGSECSLTMGNVITDKDGNTVPAAQQNDSAYKMKVAELAIVATSPEDASTGVDPATTVDITFNAVIDVASAGTTAVTIHDDTANADVTYTATASGPTISLTPDAALTVGDMFTVTIPSGSEFCDTAGGCTTLAADVTFGFGT